MKSDIFELNNNSDIGKVLSEIERIGIFCSLDSQNAMKLRLLAEEMISLVLNVSSEYNGNIWLENESETFEIHMNINTIVSDESRQNLLQVSGGVNDSTKGVLGKISSFFSAVGNSMATPDGVFITAEPILNANMYYGSILEDYMPVWSMNEYSSKLSKEEKAKEWDGLEKSILISFADDIIMGVKEKKIKMVVKKKFS